MSNIPRPEYPRPQFERSSWLSLNGQWSCEFDFSRSGIAKNWPKNTGFSRKINVPFCPESSLSGIGFTDFIDAIWYHRQITIPDAWKDQLILLHFGGVDYRCIVYINGQEVGRHTGGATPFTIDLTGKVSAGGVYDLVVLAEDNIRSGLQPHGKQCSRFQSQGCSYTRVTGIWQTVWLEAVNKYGMKKCRILPDFDNGSFTFLPEFYNGRIGNTLTVEVFEEGKIAVAGTIAAGAVNAVSLKLPSVREWNPQSPFLYDIVFTVKDADGVVLDQVKSYAGLRKIHIENGRFYLNNRPIFLRFVLDQGYYEDGIWTAPNDEALQNDIRLAQQAGFHGARLHQKVFDERFHYWADRMGYLTWAEFPDWGMGFWQHWGAHANGNYNLTFRDYLLEWSAVVERDINHPSIIAWTPLNETNEYYDLDEHRRILADVYDLTRRLDPTRPVNESSGYVHAKTDIWSVHIYDQTPDGLLNKLEQKPVYMTSEVELPAWNGQPYVVDEYGGPSFLPEGREKFAENTWGYNGQNTLSQAETEKCIADLTRVLVSNPRVAGYCYTQLTDIEQEQNGIYNYDRSGKFDMEAIRKCFSEKPEWSGF
ncbi:MAG: beta-glucuronidase [Lentisphaerae bacterium]|nr:beta-glucuronidase [Lentisphaerota bacterium]